MSDALKNDYLWSARGEPDPVVARLERALACKRYDPQGPAAVDVAGLEAGAPAKQRGVLLALPLALAAAGVLLMSLVTFGDYGPRAADPATNDGAAGAVTVATDEAADDDEFTPIRGKIRRGVKRPDENLVIGNPDQ